MSANTLPQVLNETELVRSGLAFPVVGIGASAGGVEPLIAFFEQTPADSGMAFVVILHLSPTHASNAHGVLQGVTSMKVMQVNEAVSIEPNHVYVIPPTKHLSLNDGYIRVTEMERPHGRHVAIDLFFRSLALVHRERAVAIVLSGTGTDGAVGITRIKEQGGVTIAQAPNDAAFDGMPRAAIATGHIDWVLPVAEMPQRLVRMWANARTIEIPRLDDEARAETPARPQALKEAEEAVRDVMALLRSRTGHDFRHYKRATVLRRIERRLQVNGLPNLPAYRAHLQAQPEEAHALLKDLLIGVTNFFRDPEAFSALEHEVVPKLFDEAAALGDPVRAWIPGCATGEEAYSLTMLLREHAERTASGVEIQVFASDIDVQAIAVARAGAYPESILADVSPTRLRHFFNKEAGTYRIRKDLREKVLFAAHNILRDPPFSRLDMVSCRNLLIYLDREVQPDILEMFHFALRPGGYLFLGSSESADAASQLFSVVDKKHRIYRANSVSRTHRHLPALPLGIPELRPPSGIEPPGPRRRLSYAEIHQRLVEQVAPPSVLIDADVFDEVEDTLSAEARAPGDGDRDPVVVQLEEELRRTKEQLQHTIEQSETSTEELKASNEELQAINEELRSTTEELETSKEELQSINEELITVNQELKSKVEETGKINDDLQNLIASTDIATVFVDRSLCIKRYTPRATQLFSIIASDVGRSLLDITHRLDYEHLADDAAEAFQSLRVIEREVTSSDGRWYLARVLPYRTVEDRIGGAVLTFVDITRRREAEERQRASEERMRLVVESTKDYAIVTLDLDGRITTWNKAAERIFGYSQVEVAGEPVALLFTPEDRAAGVPEAELQRAREEGRAEDDRWHRRKDGSSFFCSGITTPLREAGVLQGYAKIARDLTGSKKAEDERERLLRRESAARAEALAASQMKDEFLAVMSHELKNPLNLIQLNAELLLRLPEARNAPALARAAATIRKGVESQAQIIDDLLDLSRVSTGKLALSLSEVDWSAIVRSIAGAVVQDAAAKAITFEIDVADGVMLLADPVRIEQVVWNLLSNALKFTPKGGSVSLRLAREGELGVLQVRDSGRGIEPEFLPRVFEMFQQADSRPGRGEGGLGIGLALARHIVVLHGGRIDVHSEGAGRGACFTVRLPLRGSASAAAAGTQHEHKLPAGLRALVVDDEAQTLEMLRELLTLDGVQVTTAGDGVEALALAEREKFDVIMSDIAMPKMNGYELAEALRQKPALAATPMIALTGFGRAADAKRALAAGFDMHIAKPVTLQRLTDALLAVLRRAEEA